MALSSELKEEIKKLVERANHGDQNAMAMIEQVRKNAQGGVALAQESHKAIMQCVMGYEKKTSLDIGQDATQALTALKDPRIPPDDVLKILCFLPHVADGLVLHAACVILSKGPMWPDDKIAAVQSQVPPTIQGEFQSGFHGAGLASGVEVQFGAAPGEWDNICRPYGTGMPPNCHPWRYAGHVLGHARRIQAVRNSGLPPSQINANMGWELDC